MCRRALRRLFCQDDRGIKSKIRQVLMLSDFEGALVAKRRFCLCLVNSRRAEDLPSPSFLPLQVCLLTPHDPPVRQTRNLASIDFLPQTQEESTIASVVPAWTKFTTLDAAMPLKSTLFSFPRLAMSIGTHRSRCCNETISVKRLSIMSCKA